ncbi:putative essential cytoplasmic protein [Phaeomoniella chlamydospora]|uniref:Ataxin-10 homolog n=1 Tax=Phaeomoniella chlamydospora TaxID=158046 RepID=A0A0G2EDA8_PHACM|nr:putative essential cytoplasmic protein [Phaeomoniella chlamydospora]
MEERPKVTAPELLLKIVLTGTQMHYEHPGMVEEGPLERMLNNGKVILYKSHQESEVRQNLGFSAAIWQGLTDVLIFAIPDLEKKSFSWKNSPESNFNGSCSDLIASNYHGIIKDIERLNDLCTIARNLLATTRKAQNLAAEKGFDQQILRLIHVCVKVTSAGFDGDNTARNEEKWQKVVTLYKRLLITCLQFLHNFIMHNEHRKLVLWLDLFGNSQHHQNESPRPSTPSSVEQIAQVGLAQGGQEARIKSTVDNLPLTGIPTSEDGLGYNIDDIHALFDLMSTDKPPDGTTQEAARLLMDKIRNDMERLSGLSASQLDENPDALLKVGAALRAQLPAKDFPRGAKPLTAQQVRKAIVSIDKKAQTAQSKDTNWSDLPNLNQYGNSSVRNTELTEEDMSMPRSSQSAAETLQEAKDELMARLQDVAPHLTEAETQQELERNSTQASVQLEDSGEAPTESVHEIEEDDEDDEDYRSSSDQERGLLTDVPLVLGPTEIEALPMIIQAGIVDSFGLKGGERIGSKNMQAVRCHILLAQEAGRNVLRELLIFIAAWDLPDDEFYFKMMVQIMEAILSNGLMSHAYSDFGQAKDIISPAQAVVIKILTHIFRSKYSPTSINGDSQQNITPRLPAQLTRVDVLTVRYVFTVFRGNIIPETCALIYLQGQIRTGRALAEDFPLNLWDMERVYEGVYQFLEFFAVLTESNDWKSLLVDWEIVYDLVTLLKELDWSIPKPALTSQIPAPGKGQNSTIGKQTQPAVSVERPYDQDPDTGADAGSPSLGTEDPAEFEWRNLKKLIVLVLSSLVWKSPVVQNQIREYGGVETILSCTVFDAHNPYIKEHAVMCLKFLLEGNRENQEIVDQLEAREVVSTAEEVLEEMGVEARIEGGKVKLAARPKPA